MIQTFSFVKLGEKWCART